MSRYYPLRSSVVEKAVGAPAFVRMSPEKGARETRHDRRGYYANRIVWETTMEPNRQLAPYPALLEELMKQIKYKPGWSFSLDSGYNRGQGCYGLTFNILIECPDSYHYRRTRVLHLMPVPPASYNSRTWRRWIFEQILLVERHEAAEFFEIDGRKPFAPHHKDGNDPYTIFEPGTDEQEQEHRRT